VNLPHQMAVQELEPQASSWWTMPGNSLWPSEVAQSPLFEQILDSAFDGVESMFLNPTGRVITRGIAATYATVFRCATLISGMLADLIVNSARVETWDGDRVTSSRAGQLEEWLRVSPDEDVSAYTFIEDVVLDYLMSGNGFMVEDGVKLCRGRAIGAETDEVNGRRQYKLTLESGASEPMDRWFDFRSVAHSRWPHLGGRETNRKRRGFARPPVQVMARAVGVGQAADAYVADYFSPQGGGSKPKVGIAYQSAPGDEQKEEIRKYIRRYAAGREPLVMFDGAQITKIADSPQDTDVLKLREFQVREVARFFGIPAPLVGEHVTQWGSGIEQLARLAYRFCGRQHLHRILWPMQMRFLPRREKIGVDETELVRGDTTALAKLTPTLGGPNNPRVVGVREFRRWLGLPREMSEADKAEPAPTGIPAPTPPEPPDDE